MTRCLAAAAAATAIHTKLTSREASRRLTTRATHHFSDSVTSTVRFLSILLNLLPIFFLREIFETNSFVLYQQPTATSSSAPTHLPACTSLTIARAPSTHTRKSSSSPRARGYASQEAGSSQARPLAKSSWRGRGCCRRGNTLEAVIWVYDKRHCLKGYASLG